MYCHIGLSWRDFSDLSQLLHHTFFTSGERATISKGEMALVAGGGADGDSRVTFGSKIATNKAL